MYRRGLSGDGLFPTLPVYPDKCVHVASSYRAGRINQKPAGRNGKARLRPLWSCTDPIHQRYCRPRRFQLPDVEGNRHQRAVSHKGHMSCGHIARVISLLDHRVVSTGVQGQHCDVRLAGVVSASPDGEQQRSSAREQVWKAVMDLVGLPVERRERRASSTSRRNLMKHQPSSLSSRSKRDRVIASPRTPQGNQGVGKRDGQSSADRHFFQFVIR